jgi:hypothetical protein
MKLCVVMCIVIDGSIIARRSIRRKGLKTMKIKDIIIIVVGLVLTPFTFLFVGVIELINLIKTKRR